jgi:hypothetical protein
MDPSSARQIYHSGRWMPSANSTFTERLRREFLFVAQCWWKAGLSDIFA